VLVLQILQDFLKYEGLQIASFHDVVTCRHVSFFSSPATPYKKNIYLVPFFLMKIHRIEHEWFGLSVNWAAGAGVEQHLPARAVEPSSRHL